MTDQPTPETAQAADGRRRRRRERQPDAVIGLVTDGAYAVIVGVFSNPTDAAVGL